MVPAEEVPFDEGDMTTVLDRVTDLTASGQGWINFSPEVEPGLEPPPRGKLFALMSGRGEAVPLATWSTDGPTGRFSLGITHGSGPKALERLREKELPLPVGWLPLSDSPRRGLVVTAPVDTDLDAALWWLLTATHILSVPPLTGDWLAKLYP